MKSLKELKKRNKFKINKYLFILLCFLILSVTVGYSALQQTLEISGRASYRVPGIIRITNLELVETYNGGTEEYNSNYFKDSIKVGISLPSKDSTITYKVEISNLGGVDELVEKINSNIDSSIITYTVEGLNLYEDVLEKCGANNDVAKKVFNITFKYNDSFDFSTVANEIGVNRTIYNITLSFVFKNATPLMDSRFDAININDDYFEEDSSRYYIPPEFIQDMINNPDNYTFYNSSLKISEIESITFSNSLKLPDKTISYTNISSGGVVLLSYTDLDNNGLYEVTISGYNGVILPSNSTGLFASLQNLKTISFGNSVNSERLSDMNFMFSCCLNLINLDIERLDKADISSLFMAFASCLKIESLNLSNLNTKNVSLMNSVFYNCSSLKSLNLNGDFSTEKVKKMIWMFAACSALESLDLSNFNTTNVIDMTGIFSFCSSLTTLNLSSFDTSNVTSMSGMFGFCSSLTTLNLSNFNTTNVTDISGMFQSCSSLTILNLSTFDTSKVTDMSSMFNSCSSLTILNLSTFDTSKVTDMSSMFNNCSSLTTLDLSNFNTSNVTDMGSMFSGFESLESLDLSNFNTSNVTNMSSMFSRSKSLKNIDLSSFDTSRVTTMHMMFKECTSLTTLNLGSFKTPLLENIAEMISTFSNVINLDTLNMENFTSDSIKYNTSNALSNTNINTLYLNNWDIEKHDILKSNATYGTIYVNKKYESYLKKTYPNQNFVFVE